MWGARWLHLLAQDLGSAGTVLHVEADDLRHQASDAASNAQHNGERLIADRLDALEAERVMQRALELEADSLDEPHSITTEQLERIAKEIGVDPAFVHQALGELRMQPQERTRFAELALPEPLIATSTLSGLSRADVDASIIKWMTQHEGMVRGGLVENGVEWHVDRRLRTRVLARSLSGGNRISRVAGGDVTHRVHSVGEAEHVVALEAEGRWPLTFAAVVLAVGGALSSIVLFGALAASDLLTGLAGFAAMMAGTVGIAVGGARWWARGIRGALKRSLIGLASAAKPKRRPWFPRRRKKES